jgi:hypothetical protein
VLEEEPRPGFLGPFHRALEAFGPRFTFVPDAALTGIRLARAGDRVAEITVQHGRESAPRAERVNSLIVAIPPHQLQRVLSHPDSRALRGRVPGLLDVSKLTTQQTSSLTLYLKRRIDIPGVNQEPVALIDDPETLYTPDARAQRNGLASDYGISFIEVGKLWGADHPMVLSVLASDAESLKLLDDDEAGQNVIGVLRQYLGFEDADIDWAYSYYQPHRGDGQGDHDRPASERGGFRAYILDVLQRLQRHREDLRRQGRGDPTAAAWKGSDQGRVDRRCRQRGATVSPHRGEHHRRHRRPLAPPARRPDAAREVRDAARADDVRLHRRRRLPPRAARPPRHPPPE